MPFQRSVIMMKTIRLALTIAILGFAVVGCSKNVKPTNAPAQAPAPATVAPAAPATVNTAPAVSPLDDPNSPLAQRVVFFDFDKSDVKPEYLDTLTAHAKYLVANPTQKI